MKVEGVLTRNTVTTTLRHNEIELNTDAGDVHMYQEQS